ncbi:hypothetical protein [Pseudomonas phage Itty13]|jgi:hypothetical protein|uniref:Uncharacterized protein n=1 Tax=Pseudomonas phage Itty13 TaxID=2805750 RepID=A0A889IS99_9CAUD|nr:hypothetical protein PQC19_gp52 [Pseudomonas phage Itty13]QRE00628.1 hypothetical protein [Pseudomonas phage Itty13]
MTDRTRNERAKRLYEKRIAEGKVKLSYWVSAKARARLEVLASKAGMQPADFLEQLLERA